MEIVTTNRLKAAFEAPKNLLSLYITAGFPNLTDTVPLLRALQASNVDFVEIGLPFSDSLMDGPVIQHSHRVALENGMTLEVLFEQLKSIRSEITMPLVFMGALNPIIQFGTERFCQLCHEVGIDGVLIPDLPLTDYKRVLKERFRKYNLAPIFMITPRTTQARLEEIDEEGEGFLYVMSSNSTTGNARGLADSYAYFERIKTFPLRNPTAIGFNISKSEDVKFAHQFSQGAIVGSAFIRFLLQKKDPISIAEFISNLRPN